MDYMPLTYPCPQCSNSWESPYEPPKTKMRKKEATMQVTYNGFTGELVKLERVSEIAKLSNNPYFQGQTLQRGSWNYDLCIYDAEKKATISFVGVKLEDMKFLGGAVTFGE